MTHSRGAQLTHQRASGPFVFPHQWVTTETRSNQLGNCTVFAYLLGDNLANSRREKVYSSDLLEVL